MAPLQTKRTRRRRTAVADLERFEVREAVPGDCERLVATAATRDAARLAVETLLEEGEDGLEIVDTATGRSVQP